MKEVVSMKSEEGNSPLLNSHKMFDIWKYIFKRLKTLKQGAARGQGCQNTAACQRRAVWHVRGRTVKSLSGHKAALRMESSSTDNLN